MMKQCADANQNENPLKKKHANDDDESFIYLPSAFCSSSSTVPTLGRRFLQLSAGSCKTSCWESALNCLLLPLKIANSGQPHLFWQRLLLLVVDLLYERNALPVLLVYIY
jgi:hypothetical protein